MNFCGIIPRKIEEKRNKEPQETQREIMGIMKFSFQKLENLIKFTWGSFTLFLYVFIFLISVSLLFYSFCFRRLLL